MYNPRTQLERELFPDLGEARVTGGPHIPFIGRVGTIVSKSVAARDSTRTVVRIAFTEFWDRPNHMSSEEAEDNGYFFEGEYEELPT